MATSRPEPPVPTPTDRRPGRSADVAAAIAGTLAALVGIAVSELAAGLLAGAPSLVVAIGTLVIDLQPPGAKDVAVSLFGTNDKLALNLAVLAGALAVAGALGLIARRRWRQGVAGFVAIGLVVLYAALREPLIEPILAMATIGVALAASLLALRLLLLPTRPAWSRPSRTVATDPRARPDDGSMPDWDRRSFLIRSGTVAVASLAIGAVGRALLEGGGGQASGPGGLGAGGAAAGLPAPIGSAPPLPPASSLDVPGITPIVMPNDRFYRIDTALIVPRVDVSKWTLTVKGMVDRPVTLTYPEIVAMGLFEQYVTIACVSNVVGGDLVGNARWTGVHLRDVLAMAGVKPEATQIVGRSVDGFTVGFPTAWAMDPARDPMIAVGMNGETLPIQHGFPARLIVPGLYGYVSATKWLAEIELTTLAAFDAYWVPLGWSKEAPILTQSRIDVPRDGGQAPAGPLAIAGVAWAPDRGVSAVEVRVDDGAVAAGDAVGPDREGDLGPVAVELGRDPRRPHDRGPGDRRDGRGPDRGRLPAGTRRGSRPPSDPGPSGLTRVSGRRSVGTMAAGGRRPVMTDPDWPAYYAVTVARPPWPTVLDAIRRFESEDGPSAPARFAVDLGCGAGRDARALLRSGWRVVAIDRETEAVEALLAATPTMDRSLLETRVSDLASVDIPACDLVNASLSLPFLAPDDYDRVWQRLIDAIGPGGRFAGMLFGDRDESAADPSMTCPSPERIRSFLDDFEIESWSEKEEDGRTALGEAHHFHLIEVVARRRG